MASKKPTYWDLLRHPNWQRKRLEVMERAEFACENCRDTETTLNVHHGYYEKGKKPWEYPTESLKCLCEKCHVYIEGAVLELRQLIAGSPPEMLYQLLGYAQALAAECGDGRMIFPNSDLFAIMGFEDFIGARLGELSQTIHPGVEVDVAAIRESVRESRRQNSDTE